MGALVALCYSCMGDSVLSNTESELNELNNEYEMALEVGDDGLKCETFGSKDSIKMLKDNYVAEVKERLEVAKERVMRTAYSATSPRVGVFRVGSCGSYKSLSIEIDCENKKSKTRVEGNVGACFVDGNKNMRLEFCLVEAGNRYPGGVFLVENAPAAVESFTVVRYHDTEDGGHQSMWSDDPYYADGDVSRITGLSKLDSNATLAWNFDRNMNLWGDIPIGPIGIEYGVLSLSTMASGNLYFDDEDRKNKNWAQLWRGNQCVNDFNNQGQFYGIEFGANTKYHMCVSTDKANFTKVVKHAMGGV